MFKKTSIILIRKFFKLFKELFPLDSKKATSKEAVRSFYEKLIIIRNSDAFWKIRERKPQL